VEGERQWYINRQGQAMMIVPKPGDFWMGEGQERQTQKLNRSFAMAANEVTVEQFLRFRRNHQFEKITALSSDCPVNNVSWYDAAAYCNWLSERDGIPRDQWCYEPNEKGEYAAGMNMVANHLQRKGYRLPTEAEWEYACRSGSETRFSYGEPDDLLGKYAWFAANSSGKSHPAGALRPNDLGLFDMHGNASEWCQDTFKGTVGKDDSLRVNDAQDRVLRGGSFMDQAVNVRSAYRVGAVPTNRSNNMGFRVARTFAP
jgi:formylglycine-generating enzyme required for sulfatase activity